MKIMLAPGETVTVGFYEPADPENNSGWAPSEDHPLDGELTIEFTEKCIQVSADLPDDKERGGLCSLREDDLAVSVASDPVIYYVSHGPDSDDVED